MNYYYIQFFDADGNKTTNESFAVKNPMSVEQAASFVNDGIEKGAGIILNTDVLAFIPKWMFESCIIKFFGKVEDNALKVAEP
jgi:hypothetical protein